MPRTIMLSGPHAIGKSATCQKVSDKHRNILYVTSFAGRIAKDMNYDLNNKPTPEATLAYQEKVIRAFQLAYETSLEENTIFDRSPLDFAAYTILQLKDVTDEKLKKRLGAYISQCIATTEGYADVVFIPEADLEASYETKGNRPSFSAEQVQYRKDFMEVLKTLAGYLHFTEVVFIPADKQYEARVEFISDYLKKKEEENASI